MWDNSYDIAIIPCLCLTLAAHDTMNFFDAQTQADALNRHLSAYDGLVVACYCAAWCDSCNGYRPGFEALAARKPQHVFVWIDIEECEHLLDDEEAENFPTLLVQSSEGNLFFGPMLPHLEHLERLLQSFEQATTVLPEGPGLLKDLLERG